MTRKITSINEMCQCDKIENCHQDITSTVKRCVAYGPLFLYHRVTKEKKRFCEYCAMENMDNFSVLEVQDE